MGTPLGEALEQLHFDQLALLDDVGLCRDLDVAIGLRHAGDVARCFERTDRFTVNDSHRIELMPPGCGLITTGALRRMDSRKPQKTGMPPLMAAGRFPTAIQ